MIAGLFAGPRLWIVGAVAAAFLFLYGAMKWQLVVANRDLAVAEKNLADLRLAYTEAGAAADTKARQIEKSANELSQRTEATYAQRLKALRNSRAATPAAGGVPDDPVRPPGGRMPGTPAPAGSPDEGAADALPVAAGVTGGSLTDACAETTLQLVELQRYVDSLGKLMNPQKQGQEAP